MLDDLVQTKTENGVTTLTMNNPGKLNGWTMDMMAALKSAMTAAATDEATLAVVLTGADPYYCAGVNLGATLKPAHPKVLREMIVEHNQGLFDSFLDFPKPILVAANGPAIGASVTSATLCDAIIASERATFSTPFAALGVPPEGCSSEMFPALLKDDAQRMLGQEGFKPTGTEAAEIGLVDRVVEHDALMAEATRTAEGWAKEGRKRQFRGGFTKDRLKAVNAAESQAVADAFLDVPFLKAQYEFLKSKGKRQPAAMFYVLWKTRRLWSKLL